MAEGPSSAAGASGGRTAADDSRCTDFVDRHQLELIKRVANVEPILDELLRQRAIQQESYDEIRALPTSEEKMKVLLSGPLDSGGARGKEILYEILTETESNLMDDLRMKNVQADTVMEKKMLLETLNALSSEELQEFMSLIHEEKSFPLAPEKRLELKNTQDFVELMEKTYGQECVEMTRKVLQMMNRDDLAMSLSDTSLRFKGEPQSSLFQRVEMMVSVTELLLETLACLSDREFQKFKRALTQICPERCDLDIIRMLLWIADKWYIVFVMVRSYSQKSVEMITSALLQIERSDLAEKLSQSSSGYKKKHSVGEHQSALIHKVVTMVVVEELLLETLSALSHREQKNFKWFLQFWLFQRNPPNVLREHPPMKDSAGSLMNWMVEGCGQNSVEAAKEVFRDMKRFDLVHRLPKTSPPPKETTDVVKRWPSLTKTFKGGPKKPSTKQVEKMVFDTHLLLETLKKLSPNKCREFQFALLHETGASFSNTLLTGQTSDIQDLVFSVVQTYGRRTVEKTKEALRQIKRNDLVQKLSVDFSGSKKKYPEDDDRSRLIWRVATIAAVKQLLVDTLANLSDGELSRFRLELIAYQDFTHFSVMFERGHIAELMVQIYGQKSVEVAEDIITNIKRSGRLGMFHISRKRFKEKQFQREKQRMATAAKDSTQIFLAHLSRRDPNKVTIFKWLLQFTYFEKSLPQISWGQLQYTDSPTSLMCLMEDTHGIINSMEVAREVINDMSTNTSSALKAEHQSEPLWTEVTMTPLQKHLLETLEDLSYDELERFKHVLLFTKMKEGLPRIPRDLMEMTDRVEIAKLIEEVYRQRSVEVTSEVLKKMNWSNLVQHLSKISFGSEGPLRSLELDGCGSVMQDSSDWPKLEPNVKTTEGDKVPIYSLESEAGNFECSVSGLRWSCKEKVSFKYQFCSWDEPMERMKRIQYMPAGPVIDIIIIAGRLDEVYLPHWIFIDDNPKISEMFAVLHIDDSGDFVETASEVTPCHVKLPEPVFSPRAVLMKAGFPVKINCKVLIYKTNTAFLTLHVYLIPCDPGLQQAMDNRELSHGYDVIRKPPPEKSLKMRDRYVLTADVDGAEIYPENLKLRYENRDSHFFEVFIENPDANFMLNLTQQNECQPVWKCAIRRDEYKSAGRTKAEHFVDKHQCALIQRINNIGPILDKVQKKGVIQDEDYQTIMALGTTQEKIRKLFIGPLKASGQAGKDIFYKILQEHEPYLVADLKREESV